jgi:hypothetical protein
MYIQQDQKMRNRNRNFPNETGSSCQTSDIVEMSCESTKASPNENLLCNFEDHEWSLIVNDFEMSELIRVLTDILAELRQLGIPVTTAGDE